MSFTTPENTPSEWQAYEAVRPQEWMDPDATRAAIHAGRDVLLESVRTILDTLEPQLACNGGVCFYKTFGPDADKYSVLLTDNTELAGPDSTIIAVNVMRQPLPDEPVFPNGKVMELTDLTLAERNRWLNASRETLYRGFGDSGWQIPELATLLVPKQDSVKLVGSHIGNPEFYPAAARNLQDVAQDAEALWNAWSALRLCGLVALEENITTIEAT